MLRATAITALLLALSLSAAPPAAAGKGEERELPERFRLWLEEVEVLISKEERRAFLELERDYQREAFIRRFWEARDPDPGSPRNEFKDRFYLRLEEVRSRFKYRRDERWRIYLLNGEPGEVMATDCGLVLWPLEIWKYGYSEHTGRGLTVIFYQPFATGPFQIWRPVEGLGVLVRQRERASFDEIVRKLCGELYSDVEELLRTIELYTIHSGYGPAEAERRPQTDPEWLETFRAFSTDLPEEAVVELAAELDFVFPGAHRQRTVVRGRLRVAPEDAVAARLGERESYNFQVTGEVLRGEELFESFRYRFDLPLRGEQGGPLPLVFERYLRPGAYRLVVKLEDLNGGGLLRLERELEVPRLDAPQETPTGPEPEVAPAASELSVELVAEASELQSGLTRFTAVIAGGEADKVSFLLDGRPVLTKTRPPFSVELNLGSQPVTRAVRAVVYGAGGAELATDELLLNAGEHSFVVRLVEPQRGEAHTGSLRARAEVQSPEGQRLARLEFWLNDERVATLFQPPFSQRIELGGDGLAFVRAVAYLEDGNFTEDLVIINSPHFLEDVEVRVVELFATVVDRRGEPVADLARQDFRVFDGGAEQRIVRFERQQDLPIYASLLIDTSASMSENLPEVRRVAIGFFEQTLEARDRAAVITFSDKPRLAARFTSDLEELTGALAGLTAERSTALYDSIRFALYYFKGIKGQKALIVLSDGEDRRSESSFAEALDFARTTGVTIYAIGLEKTARRARERLGKLAAETGGRAFWLGSIDELGSVHETIQKDLRSRYLLVYQPLIEDADAFRTVDVRVALPGAEVRTLRGYYP